MNLLIILLIIKFLQIKCNELYKHINDFVNYKIIKKLIKININ